MLLISRIFLPRKSLKEAAHAFTRIQKLPATMTRYGPFFKFDDNGDIQATTFYFFKDRQITNNEKKFITNRMSVFKDVPGLTYSVEEWLEMEEAVMMVSKQQPG